MRISDWSSDVCSSDLVRDIPQIDFAIVAPDGREAMLQHVDEFAARGVPFIFDPGPAMPLFNGDEFRSMIAKSTYVIVYDYESPLLQTRTGWSAAEIASHVTAHIVKPGPIGSGPCRERVCQSRANTGV